MTLQNDTELANTKVKLLELEERYEARRKDETIEPRIRELTLFSFKKLINQLKEEIARYEASRRQSVRQ